MTKDSCQIKQGPYVPLPQYTSKNYDLIPKIRNCSLWKGRPAYAFHTPIIDVCRTPISLAEEVPHLLVKNEWKIKPEDQKSMLIYFFNIFSYSVFIFTKIPIIK